MMEVIFVTATGTDVGKTRIASHFAKHLSKRYKVNYWKPIQSGSDKDSVCVHNTESSIGVVPETYLFNNPMSPDQAAQLQPELLSINLKEFSRTTRSIVSKCEAEGVEWLLIEGAGGLCVPFNEQGETWIDWMREHQSFKSLLVAHSGLGTLNHTGLSLKVLGHEGLSPHGIVMNGPKHLANVQSLRRDYPGIPLVETNWSEEGMSDSEFESLFDVLNSKPVNLEWESFSEDHCWRPYTQHAISESPIAIEKGFGPWIQTTGGKVLFDAVGSWWSQSLGHGHAKVREAMSNQHAKLDHVLFGNCSHEPASRLSKRVVESMGAPYQKVFFSDNGSTAVEVALKMAMQMWFKKDSGSRPRKFVTLGGSYHGDTFGSMSVAGASYFHSKFSSYLFPAKILEPVCGLGRVEGSQEKEKKDEIRNNLKQHEAWLEKNRDNVAGIIVEPLLQGAGGMKMLDPLWLKGLCELYRKREIPVIFDEVFTGMGRTGSMWAFEQLDFRPDFVCIAKGLTGGCLPLALTITTEKVFESFLSSDKSDAFLHGHTFTGNPITSRIANTVFELYEQECVLGNVKQMELTYLSFVDTFAEKIPLENWRVLGSVLAADSHETNYFSRSGELIQTRLLDAGLFMRPLGGTFYFAPCFNVSCDVLGEQLDKFQQVISASIE